MVFKTNYSSAGLQLKFAQADIPSKNYIPAANNKGIWPSHDLGPTGSNSPLALLISPAGSTASHLLIYSLLFIHENCCTASIFGMVWFTESSECGSTVSESKVSAGFLLFVQCLLFWLRNGFYISEIHDNIICEIIAHNRASRFPHAVRFKSASRQEARILGIDYPP